MPDMRERRPCDPSAMPSCRSASSCIRLSACTLTQHHKLLQCINTFAFSAANIIRPIQVPAHSRIMLHSQHACLLCSNAWAGSVASRPRCAKGSDTNDNFRPEWLVCSLHVRVKVGQHIVKACTAHYRK